MSASVEAVWSQLQKQRPGLRPADLRNVPGIKRAVRDLDHPAKTTNPQVPDAADGAGANVTGHRGPQSPASAPGEMATALTVRAVLFDSRSQAYSISRLRDELSGSSYAV